MSAVAVEVSARDAYSRLDVTTAKHISSKVNVAKRENQHDHQD
jgi:hypothetical protein